MRTVKLTRGDVTNALMAITRRITDRRYELERGAFSEDRKVEAECFLQIWEDIEQKIKLQLEEQVNG